MIGVFFEDYCELQNPETKLFRSLRISTWEWEYSYKRKQFCVF